MAKQSKGKRKEIFLVEVLKLLVFSSFDIFEKGWKYLFI
jgi:hypothetical protein